MSDANYQRSLMRARCSNTGGVVVLSNFAKNLFVKRSQKIFKFIYFNNMNSKSAGVSQKIGDFCNFNQIELKLK